MLGVRLGPELEERLERLAKKTGRTKSFYAKEAIRQYVEDREDYLLAEEILRRNEPTYSLEEVMGKYGMENTVQPNGRKAVGQTRPRRPQKSAPVLPRKTKQRV